MIWSMVKSLLPALLLLCGAAAFAQWVKATKGRRGEKVVHKAIVASGAECITDFILEDGRGNLTQIDHIIKLPIGIGVIETKAYSGKIYGRAGEATWTQALGGKKSKFQNPLRQNYAHTEAVKRIVGKNVQVFGQVLFVGDATFKELPEVVSGLQELKRHLRLISTMPIPADVEDAWRALVAAMMIDADTRSAHLSQLRAKKAIRA